MATVDFTYDGASTITATVHGGVVGHHYDLFSNDPNSTEQNDVYVSDPLVLTITDVGGLSGGDAFGVAVADSDANSDYGWLEVGECILYYGLAGVGSQADVAWTYDGATALSVTFTPLVSGLVYTLASGSGQSTTSSPSVAGTPITLSLTLTPFPPTPSQTFAVIVYTTSTTPHSWIADARATPGTTGVVWNAGSVARPGGSVPATPDTLWTVEHREHEYIPVTVGHPEITTSGGGALIQTVYPEQLHFVLRLGKLDPSEIDYQVSDSALDIDGNPAIGVDVIGPKRTDFVLKRGSTVILDGEHTRVHLADGEEPRDHLEVGGKCYLAYLQDRHWPYDATLSYVNYPSGFRFKVDPAADTGLIAKDILEFARDLSQNYPAAPDSTNPAYSLDFTVDADSTGHTIKYAIEPFDDRSIYDMVRELSELDEQAGGFDFRFVPGSSPRTLEIVAPKLGDPASPVFTLEVDVVTQLANMDEVEFDNAGPTASHVLGVGAGTAQRQGGVNKHFPAVSARYRRRDRIADFGDVKNLLALEALTTAELVVDANPLHEIPITVNPAAIPNFWNITYPGVYIMVDYDLGWHHIESVQRIVEMDCTVSTEGEERVSLGLNQFYDQTLTSATSVVTDW